jgi:predicted nucleic acid-binding protein
MTNSVLTFVDASVLIYAASKPTAATLARRLKALQVLGDPERHFLASEFLRLEVLPIPIYYKRSREKSFYERFFQAASLWADGERLIQPAFRIATQFALGAMDALHVAAAAEYGAELVSAEKPSKPIYRAYSNISSIY